MKQLILFCFLGLSILQIHAQQWSIEQLEQANTAKDVAYLTQAERDAIMYINLARLFPQQFAQLEVEKYYGPPKYGYYLKKSKYKESLIKDLKMRKPVHVLVFDETLYLNAKCFAEESGKKGIVGHKREDCPKGNYAECCSYGMETGKDIALQWLIDHDVSSLGHRKICLNATYYKIGLSIHPHIKWDICAVAEFLCQY